MAVVCATQSSPSGSSGSSNTRNIVAPPITSTSRSGSTSAVHLAAADRVGQPAAHRDEHVGEAVHDTGIEFGVDGHVRDQPRHRRTHQRAGEHVAGSGNHRADVGGDIARRGLDRRRRRGERGLVHQLGLTRPPSVQRGLGGSRSFGDRGHGQVRIADFHKQIRRGAQYGSVDTRIPGPSGAGYLSTDDGSAFITLHTVS